MLNKHGVEYLAVGAYAVMYHGNFARFNKDGFLDQANTR